MLVYLCVYVCVCACLYVWVSLLVCALHPRAMVAPFLIRTIIVGLSPGSTSWPLTPVKICQVNFLRICCDHGILSAGRQQALEFLKIKKTNKKNTQSHSGLTLCHNFAKWEAYVFLTHVELFGADPVVFRELDVKFDVKVSLLERVSVLRHSLSLHHSNTPCHTNIHQQKRVKSMPAQWEQYSKRLVTIVQFTSCVLYIVTWAKRVIR